MRWASSIYGPDGAGADLKDLKSAVKKCADELRQELDGAPVDLLLGFVSPHYSRHFKSLPKIVSEEFGARVFIGCSAGGIIGGGQEIEQERCIAFTAASLPDVAITPFHLTDNMMPDLDDSTESWQQLVGVKNAEQPCFILLPEPFSFRPNILVEGLDYAFPKCVKIGGLVSGGRTPGENSMFLNDKCYSDGVVGVAVAGNVVIDTVVAQGCKPVGSPLRVTRCKRNMLFELNGEPAVMALKHLIEGLSEHERDLAKDAVFLGMVMDEKKDSVEAGDFLVRNILGIEPTTGALIIGELLHDTRTVQFHVRDASSSADELRLLLKRYRDEKLQGGDIAAAGALLFSCLGRGSYLYGQANHDSDCFRSYLGMVPLGGFFCNGEIGPIGNNTFLHGYTASFGIFREKEPALN